MTTVQIAALVLGAIASFLLGDALHAYDLPRWPHAVSILVLAVIGGYLQAVWVVALMFGDALGWMVNGGLQAYRKRRNRAELAARLEERTYLFRRSGR